VTQRFLVRYADGGERVFPSRESALAQIQAAPEERRAFMQLETMTLGTRKEIVSNWLRAQIVNELERSGYTETLIALERALEMIADPPFPEIDAAKAGHAEGERRIGEMLCAPDADTLRPPRDEQVTLTDGRNLAEYDSNARASGKVQP